ncbi:hypothetical protein OGAPHI_005602 [Ogataea philodendri]|uniref:Uncharacterized protein n=1 Tax=Ogataea philodendri TaxID=1378263 RepID=A0A9P8NZH7_9ASCO|nr:uncharacterized protein OGAPHI_005602 [Ogataea philodendri]KAH3662350.1 hypothetical protein OGAPHI_005602 [Ogataea philodendri]
MNGKTFITVVDTLGNILGNQINANSGHAFGAGWSSSSSGSLVDEASAASRRARSNSDSSGLPELTTGERSESSLASKVGDDGSLTLTLRESALSSFLILLSIRLSCAAAEEGIKSSFVCWLLSSSGSFSLRSPTILRALFNVSVFSAGSFFWLILYRPTTSPSAFSMMMLSSIRNP